MPSNLRDSLRDPRTARQLIVVGLTGAIFVLAAAGYATYVVRYGPSKRDVFGLRADMWTPAVLADSRPIPPEERYNETEEDMERDENGNLEGIPRDTKVLTLRLPLVAVPKEEHTKALWSVFIKDHDIMVERPYTPLYGVDEKTGEMVFWVKAYPDGEVGRWLCSRDKGDIVHVRGPVKTWEWKDDTWDEVVMISGGTGLTPFIQLFHTIISAPDTPSPQTRFTLLHSSRTPASLPPASILSPLKEFALAHPERFRLRLYVDGGRGSVPRDVPVESGRIGSRAIQNAVSAVKGWFGFGGAQEEEGKKVLFLVCGPDEMVSTIAGPYGRNFSQGEVGGILKKLGYSSSDVWKM